MGSLVKMPKKHSSLRLGSHVKKIIDRTILITGNARSGTTIAGKIIGSCENCEYFFEPELLFSLFPLINKISKREWQLVFETYVVEDLVAKAVLARNINMRKQDDSYFLNTKTKETYLSRLKEQGSRKNVLKLIQNKIPVIKIPDIVIFLNTFQRYYPTIKIIICTRNKKAIFKSTKKKKWYSKSNLNNHTWPFYLMKKKQVPFFIHSKKAKKWSAMTENEKILENINQILKYTNGNFLEIDYEKLLQQKNLYNKYLKKLRLVPTKKTIQNISLFKRP
jgi:hypothetical protein